MTPQEIEDFFIRSLDVPMNPEEKEIFLKELQGNTQLAKHLSYHKQIRELVRATQPASFGPYFANKLILKIQNTGVVIERQIFAFFKKYQLIAAGIIIALLMLNVVLSEQQTVSSIFGLEDTTTPVDEIVSFDLYKTLNQ